MPIETMPVPDTRSLAPHQMRKGHCCCASSRRAHPMPSQRERGTGAQDWTHFFRSFNQNTLLYCLENCLPLCSQRTQTPLLDPAQRCIQLPHSSRKEHIEGVRSWQWKKKKKKCALDRGREQIRKGCDKARLSCVGKRAFVEARLRSCFHPPTSSSGFSAEHSQFAKPH